jgi:hypothetical protein
MTTSILSTIHTTFEKWLTLPTTEVIDVICAGVIANRLPGPPVFLVFVGPSGSGKSELIESLMDLDDIRPISKLTPRTFLSGFKDSEESLLMKLPTDRPTIFTIKDFTTILTTRVDDRIQIIAQLREIYDGRFSADWGTKSLEWSGKVGIVAGCTGAYDEIAQSLSSLGERFVAYKPDQNDPISLAERAMRGAADEKLMKTDLRTAMKLLDSIPVGGVNMKIPYDVRMYLAKMCAFLARLRTPVPRNHQSKITAIPEIESTGRLAKQFAQLAVGLAVVRGHSVPMKNDIDTLDRVALGSAPIARVKVLRALPWDGHQIRPLADVLQVPKSVIHRTLEDLCLVGLVVLDPTYRPNPEFAMEIATLKGINDDEPEWEIPPE